MSKRLKKQRGHLTVLILSFEEFKKRKQINRSSVIANNGKKKKANVEVKIQVGILHGVDGVLRKVKEERCK